MASFEYNGTNVHYDVQGKGPDLLFMHGLGADRRQAQQSLDSLSGYRLISLDMPGHGDSPLSGDHVIKNQVSFAFYADVAKALLSHLGVRTVIAGGISMGAGIALHLAMKNPDLVQALLLVRPAWLDRPGYPQLGIIEDIGNWIEQDGQHTAETLLFKHPVYSAAVSENPTCAASIMETIHRPQAMEAAAVLSAMVKDQPFRKMGSLAKCLMPALVVGNNADPLHPAIIARETSGALGNSEYFHAPPKYLEPEAYKKAVRKKIEQFLKDCFQTQNT